MKDRLKKYAPWVAYPLFYLFAFVLSLSWTFPHEKIRDRIVSSFNADRQRLNAAEQLQIGDIDSYRVTGIRMKDVRWISASTDPKEAPTELHLDEVRARLAIFPLLAGIKSINFNVLAFTGSIYGNFSQTDKEQGLDITVDGVDLAVVGPVTGMVGVPVEGKWDGTTTLKMPEGKTSKATGNISFEMSDVAVGDGKAKIKGLLALPRLEVGVLTIQADVKEGVVKLTKMAAGGKDLELQGEGRVQLREQTAQSQLDLNVRFKINDGYRTKSDLSKALFGAPGAPPGVFDTVDPKVKKSKRPDGFYSWHARGQLGRPDFDPAPNATFGGAAPARP